MRIIKILQKKKTMIQVELLLIIISLLFIISGFFVYRYINSIRDSTEYIYEKMSKGNIEIRLLEEQLNNIKTTYALGLSGKASISEINYIVSNTVTNLSILLQIYPDEQYIIDIGNSVLLMIELFDNIEDIGFTEKKLTILNDKIREVKNIIISFKASNRLRGSNELTKIQHLASTSNNIFIILLLTNGILLICFGVFVIKILSQRLKIVSRSIYDLQERESEIKDDSLNKEFDCLAEMSSREKEVLSLIAQGYSNKEIADKLNVVEQTVKNYVSNIYYKTGVHDRVQITIMAIRAGLDVVKHDDNK